MNPTDKAGQRAPLDSSASVDADPSCGDDCGLPRLEISDRHRHVQAAAFALLLDVGQPVNVEQIATRASLEPGEVENLLADFDAVGRVRFDDDGRVVGIAGLSIEPTCHRLDLPGATRWTWCALDAIGILGALHRDATFTTRVPGSDRELALTFTIGGPGPTDAVVFIADGYGSDSVVDTWCPTVNMFDDTDAATVWARSQGISGRPIAVVELAPDAAAMWAPLVAG